MYLSACKAYLNRTLTFKGFLCGSAGKESTRNVGDLGSIPGLGRSPGEGKGYPLKYSGLENSMDCIVHGVTKRQTLLSDFLKLCNLVCTLESVQTQNGSEYKMKKNVFHI